MSHLSDDELVLHHYGEDESGGAHLAECHECTVRYHELSATLALVVADEPQRGEHYGAEVWQRIRHRLPERRPWWHVSFGPMQFAALATAASLLLAAGFAAGRLWPSAVTRLAPVEDAATEAARQRVLLLTVADHLERSDRVLTDIVNTAGGGDISREQQWAADLVAANRLYRQDAMDTDEAAVAAVLDELERTLLEIVHRPSTLTAQEFDDIRTRIDSAALLFKVRVVRDELRDRELAAPVDASTSISSTIG
jgi:hypothetical protein